jgi:hypothetical protein
MGFLDNLESSLKNLETRDERGASDRQRVQSDRARDLAVAPWSEKLKNSPYTKDLFDKAVAAGHRRRTKVYLARIDKTVRLEAKERRLELKPTPDGILAEYVEPNGELRTESVDLSGDPQALIDRWLGPEHVAQLAEEQEA